MTARGLRVRSVGRQFDDRDMCSDSYVMVKSAGSGTERLGLTLFTRHNIAVTGAGDRTVLFANGYGCDQTMWRFVAPAFQDEYRVVLFDYVGTASLTWLHTADRSTAPLVDMLPTFWT
jgi:pimeloyl-ACP methyl ester carboxylesterase